MNNNIIGTASVANSGNDQGSGIGLDLSGTGTHTALVTNNQIRRYGNTGIQVNAGASGITTAGGMQLTFTGNTITEPENSGGAVANGIHVNSGTNSGNAFEVCVDIKTNSIAASGNNVNIGEEDFRVRQRQSTTVRLPGYAGSATDDAAVVSFIQGQNTGAETGSASHSVGFTGGAACTQPTVPN